MEDRVSVEWRQLLFDFLMRDAVATVDAINAFLNRRHTLHAIRDLINCSIIWQPLNRL